MIEANKPNINLFIVGAAKCGTTSLYHILNEHPEIFFPRVKELNFYSQVESRNPLAHEAPKKDKFYHNKVINDRGLYYSLFKESYGYKVVGDCSPSYLWDPSAANKIYNDYPDAKILIILRNPVDRAFSHYLMDVREGSQTESDFYRALIKDRKQEPKIWGYEAHLYEELGYYSDQIKNYDVFKKENVKVLRYEDFFSNLDENFKSLLDFLNLNKQEKEPRSFNTSYNSYGTPKNEVARIILKNRHRFVWLKKLLPSFIKRRLKNDMISRQGSKPAIPEDAKLYLKELYREELVKLEQIFEKTR